MAEAAASLGAEGHLVQCEAAGWRLQEVDWGLGDWKGAGWQSQAVG